MLKKNKKINQSSSSMLSYDKSAKLLSILSSQFFIFIKYYKEFVKPQIISLLYY
jgi:hypothetical protein